MKQFRLKNFQNAVADAIRAAGGHAALAKHLDLERQGIYQWKRVPAHHVLKIEKVTGIPRHKLRPDLYPDPATERVA